MKFPGAPYGMKMACGENPKRVYGGRGRAPSTRMGNFAVNRQTWLDAKEYAAKRSGPDRESRDLAKETLAGVLDGDILVHNHCYRADEMALVMDMAKEFGYKVSAFHHAVESYKIGDLLKENGVCSAIWADWYGFKMESYDGIPENAALLRQAGACVVIHSHPATESRSRQGASRRPPDGHSNSRCRGNLVDHPQCCQGNVDRRDDRQPDSWQNGRCRAVERQSAECVLPARESLGRRCDAVRFKRSKTPSGKRFRAWSAR
jgi:hypothetical protein